MAKVYSDASYGANAIAFFSTYSSGRAGGIFYGTFLLLLENTPRFVFIPYILLE